jgi:hypothetical protein
MNRKATYADDRKKRVISVHNGRWVAQKFTAGPRDGKGSNRVRGNKNAQDHVDPWENIAPVTDDRARALASISDNTQARV